MYRRNNSIAANPTNFTVMKGICLHPNALANPDTMAVIALSIEGCVGVIPIIKKDQNALKLTTIRKVNIYSVLNREQVQLQIIKSMCKKFDLTPIQEVGIYSCSDCSCPSGRKHSLQSRWL